MTVLAGVTGLACGIGLVWYLIRRGPRPGTVSEADFNDEYDRSVAAGRADEAARDAAWRDFDAWQATNERERLQWEQTGDE